MLSLLTRMSGSGRGLSREKKKSAYLRRVLISVHTFRPIVICALDTGMRKGEILKLVRSDLDFQNRVITVRAFNTKTMRERHVAMTERLAQELAPISERLSEEGAPVFGIKDDFKKAFVSA